MSDQVAFLRRQAARCRRLARETADLATAESLDILAEEYEHRAEMVAAESAEQSAEPLTIEVLSPRR